MPKDAAYLVNERSAGSYARQLVVGDGLSLDAIVAAYHDGVLTLTIPVAEQSKPRRITVGQGKETNPNPTIDHKTINGNVSIKPGAGQDGGPLVRWCGRWPSSG